MHKTIMSSCARNLFALDGEQFMLCLLETFGASRNLKKGVHALLIVYLRQRDA